MFGPSDLIDCPYDFEEFDEQDDVRDYYCELLPIYHAWAIAYDNELPNPLEIVHILLPFVNILELNNQGQNILHVAAFINELDIFKYGITNNVNVYVKDNNDKHPDYANEFNHTSICEYINKKMDKNIKEFKSYTAYEVEKVNMNDTIKEFFAKISHAGEQKPRSFNRYLSSFDTENQNIRTRCTENDSTNSM